MRLNTTLESLYGNPTLASKLEMASFGCALELVQPSRRLNSNMQGVEWKFSVVIQRQYRAVQILLRTLES